MNRLAPRRLLTARASATRFSRNAAGQRGQVLVLVILSMFVLITALALGVDAGRIYVERRAAQAAVDHAATSAAFARCRGTTEAAAITAGLAAAALNGYNSDGVTNSVTITLVSGNRFQATIDSSVGASFGRAIGFDEFPVSVEAMGDCTGGGPGSVGAIWAGGDSCTGGKYGFDNSGSSQRVYGGVHSNADVNLGSSPNWWTDRTLTNANPPIDPFTYVGVMKESPPPAGNVFEPGYPQRVYMPSPMWPAGWAPSDVTTKMTELRLEQLATANGTRFTSKVTSLTKNGVIWTNHPDGMDISSVSPGVDTVTLVATEGPIKISVSSRTFRAHTGGILMISNETYSGIEKCDKFTVAISGSDATWDGLIWGPGGLIELSGSTNATVNGTLLGWAVKLNGSNITIVNNPALFATPPNVFLVH